MKWTIYDIETGIIKKILTCDYNTLLLNLSDDEDYVIGEYIDTKYVIDLETKQPILKE